MLFSMIIYRILAIINVLLTIGNSRYLLKVKHSAKINRTLALSTVAYLIIAYSNSMTSSFGFVVALIGTVVTGVSFTMGELTMLGTYQIHNTNYRLS
jgi:hypothetical protein